MTSVLSTTFRCNTTPPTSSTWVTTREKNPLEDILVFAARHKEEVEKAMDDCDSQSGTIQGHSTTWASVIGSTTYSSDYGGQQHDDDVADIKTKIPEV